MWLLKATVRNLWLPSFGLFLPSSVKSMLSMKIIIKIKKKKDFCMRVRKIIGWSPAIRGLFKGVGMTTLGIPYFQNNKDKKQKKIESASLRRLKIFATRLFWCRSQSKSILVVGICNK